MQALKRGINHHVDLYSYKSYTVYLHVFKVGQFGQFSVTKCALQR